MDECLQSLLGTPIITAGLCLTPTSPVSHTGIDRALFRRRRRLRYVPVSYGCCLARGKIRTKMPKPSGRRTDIRQYGHPPTRIIARMNYGLLLPNYPTTFSIVS